MAEDPSQIREAIEETRIEIAETMEALGQKADVKGRLSEQVKVKTEDLRATAVASAEQVKAKLGSAQEQARAALPDSAYPAADAAVARAPDTAASVAADPSRQRTAAIGAGLFLLVLLMRRRRRKKG